MQLFTKTLKAFEHLLFPQYCEGCGTDTIHSLQPICEHCTEHLPITNFIENANNPVEKTFYGRVKVQAAGAAFYFTKNSLLQHLIFQLKYKNNKQAGIFLGMLLGKQLASSNRFYTVSALVPLPLNKKKEQKRGYNQAAIIAEGIQTYFNKPILNNAVIRTVNTKTQTHENRINRWQNMQEVFAVANPTMLHNQHILLIDDVVTTGATLESCGQVILQIPNTELSIATVAYTY